MFEEDENWNKPVEKLFNFYNPKHITLVQIISTNRAKNRSKQPFPFLPYHKKMKRFPNLQERRRVNIVDITSPYEAVP